ncbi:MAG: ATP-dependent DNA helicase RecG [Thermoleophilia bacterium]
MPTGATAPGAIVPDTPPLGSGRGAAWPAPPPPRRPPAQMWRAPLTDLPGVGRTTAERARALAIRDVGGLLSHLPARYEAYDQGARTVARLVAGEEATVRVVLDAIAVQRTRRRSLRLVRARVHDDSGRMAAVWFNQEHLARILQPGDTLLLRGRMGGDGRREMAVRSHEVLDGRGSEGLHTQGLVPVYPATEQLPVRRIRELVDLARPLARAAPERLPAAVRQRLRIGGIADALVAVHFPRSRAEAWQGRRRLVLEELIVLQLGLLAVRRHEESARAAPALRATGELSAPLLEALPFRLTPEQRASAAEIARDLARTRPMRRLLQGEVGSGKTLVAVLAVCQAVEAGHQAALLVPTETLAEQHLRTLDELLAPAGIAPLLLTGRVPRAERERRLMALSTGTAPVAVGTQALLSEGVDFARLGLVVVDEQHRFGVEQRQALSERARGAAGAAHLLYMTATPIPRTLALTAYGDLRVSTIRGRPPGRSPVETRWVREQDRESAYDLLRAQLRAGRQAYVICPLVEEGAAAEARAAVTEAERLRAGPLAAFGVGLAHGAQKTEEKRAAMADFAQGRTDVLVATTVVEVGIDVPNATVILIEGADRFGLAQLHQLRGRVGRGEHPGLCLLFGEPPTDEGARRLEALTQTSDGFRLAELDLEIRGEGSILGLRQAGATDLRFARLGRDRRELAEARHVAKRTLARDPGLTRPEHGPLRAAVLARFEALPRLLDA